ncbi:MAG: preprotein translocase subunit SecG [Pseudohaliea sp.]
MEQIVLIVHLLLALTIIGLIMLQQGKGADMGASFGAGASQTLLGSTGSANVLTRATAWLVAAFFATSFGLAIIATEKTRSVDEVDIAVPAAQQPAADEASTDDLPAVEQGDVPAATPVEGDLPTGDIPEA